MAGEPLPPPLPPAMPGPDGAAPPRHLTPRAVATRRALAWYEDAMRLVKRAPATWLALGFVTLATEFAADAIPGAGAALGKLLVPLVACGMLYAAAAADGNRSPSLRHAFAAFRAGGPAIAAIVVAGFVTFAAEALAAWWIADANLFAPDAQAADLSLPAVTGIYAIGILASLPLTFVPFPVLFEHASAGAAFAASWNAFVLNTWPLLAYAAASFVLLAFGLATMGFGLVLVLPLWAASSYAAWKDVFGVGAAPAVD